MRTRSTRRLTLALALAAATSPLAGTVRVEGDLPRRADPGFTARAVEGRLAVHRVEESSPAALAGLREGDRLVAIGGREFAAASDGLELVRGLDGGRPATLTVERDSGTAQIAFTPPPTWRFPTWRFPDLEVPPTPSRGRGAVSPIAPIEGTGWLRGYRMRARLTTRSVSRVDP